MASFKTQMTFTLVLLLVTLYHIAEAKKKVKAKSSGMHKPKLTALIMHTSWGKDQASDCKAFATIVDKHTKANCTTPNLDVPGKDEAKPNEVNIYDSDELGECDRFLSYGPNIDMNLRIEGDDWALPYVIAEFTGHKFRICTDDGEEISIKRNGNLDLLCQ